MGHTVFIEDAVETNNLIKNNLVILTKASHSLLNTDATPASFWITHPDNFFIDNVAAGSERYGFWFDLQETAIGPSFDKNVCPVKEKLGQFSGNVAHSNVKYGLRIFHELDPHENACGSVAIDEEAYKTGGDPYANNPLIPAVFEDFLSYKNGRNGIIAEDVGAVVFRNIKVADNGLAGIEVSHVISVREDQCYVDGAVVVG